MQELTLLLPLLGVLSVMSLARAPNRPAPIRLQRTARSSRR